MFTGIVEEIGTVQSVARREDRVRLVVEARTVLEDTGIGDSIAVDGVCQTVAGLGPGFFSVDTLAESLKKTTLGRLGPKSRVNLERALRADSRLGGHFVQGHVGAVATIVAIREARGNVYLSVAVPVGLLRYCVGEGSIALDGISLTIAEISESTVTVNVIPVTVERTTLQFKKPGDAVNVETDIIGRYVESLLHRGGADRLSPERMKELGY